jgi:hypothetical protein
MSKAPPEASTAIEADRSLWIVGLVSGLVVLVALVGVAALAIVPLVLPQRDDHPVHVADVGGGTVLFGAAGSACTVTEASTTLPAGGPMYVVGILGRPARPGETIVATVTASAATIEMRRTHVRSPTPCVAIEIPAGAARPDRYTFAFMIDDEVVATGTVEVTP